MRGIVPENIRTCTTKIGFADPRIEWISGPYKEFILDNVNSREFLDSPLWDGSTIRSAVQKEYEVNKTWKSVFTAQRNIHIQRFIKLFKTKRNS